jgi:multiple sugar transport system ATP-binding protein
VARVELRNVCKRFEDGTRAVSQVSLEIEDGELVVLVGASGCGKSTLLRLLAGLESVTEGEILIDGRRVNEATPQQRNIAMVFQNYALYPHMTVRGNLAFPLRMAGLSKAQIDARVGEIAGLLQLSQLMDRRPAKLSGGQRQRVAMGRALVRNPTVFLMDEPLSNLDASLRALIRAQIAQIQKRLKTTTLYVTHDQAEAMTLGDRVVVLDHGEPQQIGTPQDLYHSPRNSFVAGFIGSPGMNLLPSKLSDDSGRLVVRLGSQQIKPALESRVYQRLLPHCGRDIHIGIRPEAFAAGPERNAVELHTEVIAVEFLGHESLVYLSLSGAGQPPADRPLVARLPGRFRQPVDKAAVLHIGPEMLYFFDQTGRNILNEATGDG